MHRHLFFRSSAVLASLAALFVATDASAQVSGTSSRPLPDVMLLVDSSGSMERKPDNSLPKCLPGDPASEANRWAMLLQALTGNIQPYFSCASVSRAKGTDFAKRYSIATKDPYDVDYFLPYNQPMSGSVVGDGCVMSPWKLPGASTPNGVGANGVGADGLATDFPDEALAAYKYSKLLQGLPVSLNSADQCTFEQTNDGQLDAAMTYARFALMTFDTLLEAKTGYTSSNLIDTTDPFTGTWSYLRNSGNVFYSTPSNTSALLGYGAQGAPGTTPACAPTLQEVGGRNAAAPPWEGRLIKFPDPDATLYDLVAQNALVQQTLLATRPFGATPIDGILDDARDYFWNDPTGPNGTAGMGKDPYACRDKYIILLTDGAPNLDLRPSCAATNGICPYPSDGGTIANEMYTAATQDKKVTTFVIGFSVNGVITAADPNDGFPASLPTKNCKAWFDQAAGTATTDFDKANNMKTACNTAPVPAAGTTGAACCKLNDIALQGSGQGAYFAESQADVVLSFGRIMANIIHSASTKTIPAFSSPTQYSAAAFAATGAPTSSSAQYIASYIPSAQTPWAGELDCTRFVCNGSNVSVPDPLGQLTAKGDFMSENLARQSADSKRLFISVLADKNTLIDSAASVRPFANGTPASSTGGDLIGKPGTADKTYSGEEVFMNDYKLDKYPDWPLALNVTNKTCRRGRAVKTGVGAGAGTSIIPALDDPATGAEDCSEVLWGFATATPNDILKPSAAATKYEFNVRCRGNNVTSGTCSISGTAAGTCTPGAFPSTCPSGEVCVPLCAALGAIFHSSPAVITPPQNLIREEGFRAYQSNRALRRTVTYAASTDGIMHAFRALDESGVTGEHELWGFVPPAVLPRLAANYPAGNQILLDGTPVVREAIWDRLAKDGSTARQWHTTLVSGMGTFGGYYALNVTDADCGGSGASGCLTNYEKPDENTVAQIMTSGDTSDGTKKGPHFLWQLTDVPAESPGTEKGKVTRQSPIGGDQVSLFGKNTSTPAVGILQIKATDGDHQVGVAILPGGYEDAPIKNGTCARATQPAGIKISDLPVRDYVRKWQKGNCTEPVPGRNVTIVRLDNGEVIRVFGRIQDTPYRLQDKLAGPTGVTETLFDSPMVGTPVVYPDQVGVPIQKIFIGDADGTVWRIDVTNTDPKEWQAYLFADLFGVTTSPAPSTTAAALISQPVVVPPVLSTDDSGNVIVNAATGDQESIVVSTDINYVYSIKESRDATLYTPKAQTLWYKPLADSERVTGPMTVFDRTLFFATYKPTPPSGSRSCDGLGVANIWGLHYTIPDTTIDTGGQARYCPNANIDTATGICTGGYVPFVQATDPVTKTGETDIIPGVSLMATQSCYTDSGKFDEYGNGRFDSVSQTTYQLAFGIAKPNGAGTATQASRSSIQRPLPRVSTKIDAWSIVVE